MEPWVEDGAARQAAVDRMRDASGVVTSTDPLVKFLYILARNEVPTGKIEDIILQFELNRDSPCIFTNGWLAEWAKDAAYRLRMTGGSKEVK